MTTVTFTHGVIGIDSDGRMTIISRAMSAELASKRHEELAKRFPGEWFEMLPMADIDHLSNTNDEWHEGAEK